MDSIITAFHSHDQLWFVEEKKISRKPPAGSRINDKCKSKQVCLCRLISLLKKYRMHVCGLHLCPHKPVRTLNFILSYLACILYAGWMCCITLMCMYTQSNQFNARGNQGGGAHVLLGGLKQCCRFSTYSASIVCIHVKCKSPLCKQETNQFNGSQKDNGNV